MNIPIPMDTLLAQATKSQEIASILSLQAPVDFLAALDPRASDSDPQPFAVVSVGLRSLEEAKQVFGRRKPVQEIHPGVYLVEVGRHHHAKCLIAPALGTAPARLVCGDRDRDIEALYPYMTRGLPTLPPSESDLHGELRYAPVQQRFGRQLPSYLNYLTTFASHELGTGDRKFDAALSNAMTGIANEAVSLLNDLDGLTFDLALRPDAQAADGEVTVQLKSAGSWVSQRLLEKANESGPAPAIFWKVPVDADMAAFGRGYDPKAFGGMRRLGSPLLDGLLARAKFPATENKAVVSLFERLLAAAPVSVSAMGHGNELPPTPRTSTTPPTPEDFRAALSAALGWQLWGLDEPPARSQAWLRDLAALCGRPAFRSWIADVVGMDRKQLPTVRMTPFGGKTLDKGTQALEIAVPLPNVLGGIHDAKTKPPEPLSYWVVVMPDGQRTWIGASADKASIEKRLATAKTGSPDSQTLSAKPGLEHFKTGRHLSGGFVNIRAFADTTTANLVSLLGGRGPSGPSLPVEALAGLPNKGQTPILLVTTAEPGQRPRTTIKFRIERGTINDIASLIAGLHRHSATLVSP